MSEKFAMHTLPVDDPCLIAWEAFKKTPEYLNSRQWAKYDEHLDGAMWNSFLNGFLAGGYVRALGETNHDR